ncbi:ATP-binding protein [Chryseolinea sp. T2]|uniref:PAS domain-containing sensor histidine kinase n=1 Tax=Chryseolinea sp. T2 TaxID=3129255 RepID=UPI00307709AF
MSTFSIFDRMLEGVQVIDHQYRYLYVNDAAMVQGKKHSRDELIGRTMMECYPGIDQTPLFERIKTCLQSGVSQEWINEFEFPDATKGFFQLKIISIHEGALIMSFDVTDQKKAEAIIKDNNEYLELMVSMRTAELKAQQIIIEDQLRFVSGINETRERLFAVVAHDLVAPLQSVQGLINLLLGDTTAFKQDGIRSIIEQLHLSVQNTISLAEKLILWARTQTSIHSRPQLEQVRVAGLVDDVVRLYQALAEKKKIKLVANVAPNICVNADEHQLSFIIRNLVNNAIKFTGNGGEVRIEVHERESKVEICVSDTGIGISKSLIEKIQRAQVDRSVAGTIGEKGTGLGLMLCYEFIAQNKWHIDVESVPGIGSAFKVHIQSDNKEED